MNDPLASNAAYVPVSVIIPCYCCAGSIERAVDSVMAQTLLPKEMILVDDASPDEGKTADKLRRLKKHFSNKTDIKLIMEQVNGGPAVARNSAWNAATQPFIAFLDADDAWHPQKLEIQYAWMLANKDMTASWHDCIQVYDHEPLAELPNDFSYTLMSKKGLLLSNDVYTRSVMLKRSTPFRFDPAKRVSEDYLLWLQIVCSGYRMAKLDVPLGYYFKARYGEGGLSGRLWEMEKGELSTYWQLRSADHIGAFMAVLLSVYSLGKFARRLVKSRL
ncbi:MAG: glycosyltransferase family 2 protein [Mariprofundaceae bacterium]